ncbi:NrfD/PsrC family molybdoenzyme membrane anchor subunit [Jatrophihabitans sp.]|uniref:NrfD/PsrC family molybdoenzyme membrane anchor subunit n=1 Tax=Jatrophihabitans sp. TaxID=1932789 RepID=UPI002C02D228|nr:NrfD/PsrC family molybdoenzyme membrane anchor subunit [Jatrophihabitans sp.]
MTEHRAELHAEGRLDPSVRNGAAPAGRRGRVGRRRRDEHQMVPDAVFTSYYGRPVVKASPWEADIPAYLFLGGLAAGSSLLGAGAGLTGRPVLRRAGRVSALGAISVSFAALVHDLGRPARFVNMLRVAKPTSPMSVGTWILTGYGPLAGLAGAAELLVPVVDRLPCSVRPPVRLLGRLAGPAGVGAALVAPAVASYTAALLANTSTPTWSASRKQLPFVFVGSASAAAGGLGMLLAPVSEAGPARRLALGGALLELGAERAMEASMGVTAEPLHQGLGGTLMRASKALTAMGAAGSLLARRSRIAAAVSGAALLAGSVCTRFGIFEAGQASARDPKYTVLPQRQRIERGETAGA